MSLPDRTTALIVGAGLTGLATALSLLHHGFHDFIIVDALPQGRNTSRSVLCHASALEALDTIGCGDDVVSQGLKSTAFDTETRFMKLFSLQTEYLRSHTRHPYFLTITQNVIERVLERKLASFGIIIHRPLTVVGLKHNAENPQLSDATFEDGSVITTKYVIGADGARSAIRTMAGIGFSDPTFVKGEEQDIQAQMIIADLILDNFVDTADLIPKVTVSPNGTFSFFPLPSSFNESLDANDNVPISQRVYRILCGVPLSEGEIPRSRSTEYIQKLVDRFGPYRLSSDPTVNPRSKPTQIKQVVWSSRFRNRSSAADTTFVRLGTGNLGNGGVILLVGDAAHIHSPAGGQGINLGLHDGVSLGDALTKHIGATETKPLLEADAILHEFAAARRARALETIKFTKGIAALEGLQYRERMAWWFPIDSGTYRVWALWITGWIVGWFPFVGRNMVWDVSGLGKM